MDTFELGTPKRAPCEASEVVKCMAQMQFMLCEGFKHNMKVTCTNCVDNAYLARCDTLADALAGDQ